MTDPDVGAVELDARRRPSGQSLVHEVNGTRGGATFLDHRIDDRTQGIAHDADMLKVGGRPWLPAGVEDLMVDEPAGRVGGLVELVDEMAGFELMRVEEPERVVE